MRGTDRSEAAWTGSKICDPGFENFPMPIWLNLKDTYETANHQRDSVRRLASWLEERSDVEPNWETAGFVPDIPSLTGNSPIEGFAGFASEIVTGLRHHAETFASEHRVLLQGSVVEGGGLPTKGRLRSSVQLHQRASVRYVACLIHV